MKRNLFLIAVPVLIVAGLAAFAWMHRPDLAMLNPQGPVGLAERNVMLTAMLLPMVVVIPVFFLLFYFAWKYRAGSAGAGEKHAPNWDHDNPLAEASWWLVPIIIIAILGWLAWQSAHALDPYKPLVSSNPPITVEVVALDWKWLFIYPQQGVASINQLVIPVNTPVHFELTADAPMNSFWIPSLGGQIMVMPGMQTQLNLMASKVGTFNGSSANISGEGFAGMAFPTKSVSQSDFTAWVQSAKQGSVSGTSSMGSLTMDSYMILEKPTEDVPPATYSSIDTNLYNEIMMYQMEDGGMPANMTDGSSTASTTMSDMNMQGTTGMKGMNMSGM